MRVDDNGECVAKEVFNYKDRTGYFASSIKPRSPRASTVAYRIGQVIRHKRWGYRGVIIGWDIKAKVCFLIITPLGFVSACDYSLVS